MYENAVLLITNKKVPPRGINGFNKGTKIQQILMMPEDKTVSRVEHKYATIDSR